VPGSDETYMVLGIRDDVGLVAQAKLVFDGQQELELSVDNEDLTQVEVARTLSACVGDVSDKFSGLSFNDRKKLSALIGLLNNRAKDKS
jgi:hypothetical protein